MQSILLAKSDDGSVRTQPIAGVGFDFLMVGASIWLAVGLHLDGWAHNHIADLETFFTPWHAVLYSGFFALSAVLVGMLLLNCLRGHQWWNAMPHGYELSLLGVPLFLFGGLGDMTWHTVFGIEEGVEALLSPTHLVLALSVVFFFTGPILAAWRRTTPTTGRARWKTILPTLIAQGLLLSLFAFFTQYASPFATVWPGGNPPSRWFAGSTNDINQQITEMAITIGIAGMLVQTALLMGILLLTVRRWVLPFGSVTVIIGISTVLMAAMRDQTLLTGPVPLIGVGILTGLTADVLLRWLKPNFIRLSAVRVFAFAVPVVLYSLYFGLLVQTVGLWWSIALWTGSIVLAGVVGLLVSFLVFPPRVQDHETVELA